MKTIVYNQKEVKLLNSCDVLVVGGGTSGVVAALSALEQQQSVIVLEKGIYLCGYRSNVSRHGILSFLKAGRSEG